MTVFRDLGNMAMSFGRAFKSASTSRICITRPIIPRSSGEKRNAVGLDYLGLLHQADMIR